MCRIPRVTLKNAIAETKESPKHRRSVLGVMCSHDAVKSTGEVMSAATNAIAAEKSIEWSVRNTRFSYKDAREPNSAVRIAKVSHVMTSSLARNDE